MDNYIESLKSQINDIREKIKETQLLTQSNDEVIQALAIDELKSLTSQEAMLNESLIAIENAMNSKNEKSDAMKFSGNIILEIRAGTGGDEAGLFANDLLSMYLKFAEMNKWNSNIVSKNEGGIGNIKEVIVEIDGTNPSNKPYSKLKYESGVHRVQRVPVTESSGRIHTSTITVAILPIVENSEINIKPEDLRIDTYRSSGAGGQHVNKTESAIRITHIPTNVVVQCQDERSQHKNRERAMTFLATKLYDLMQQQQKSSIDDLRAGQVGTGERSEKIKTYNMPQDRLTDHRIKKSWFGLNDILLGNIDEILTTSKQMIESGAKGNDEID